MDNQKANAPTPQQARSQENVPLPQQGYPAGPVYVVAPNIAQQPQTFVVVNPKPPPQQLGQKKPEGNSDTWTGFDNMTIRQRFIRKVYLILMCQLLVTTLIVASTILIEDVEVFVRQNPGFFLAAYVIFIVVYLILVCCDSVRRKWPGNFIFLAIFTLAFAYIMAAISIRYKTASVLMALGISAGCCLVITIFSFNTRYDITSWLGIVVVVSFIVMIVGFISLFTIHSFPVLHRIYSGLAAALFMIYLAIDTQMLLGDKKYSLSPEEYIFASLQLYMDIVNLFIVFLSLLGERK